MSLPAGFLDELRTRTSLARVVGRKVTWDQRKSNQAKGDMWAPCPFHQEKTASFHVDDRQGFYYCFGCHAKGDAITFVRETENAGFMEAIEILAREAGMQIPARDPDAQRRADRRTELSDVMEQAVRHYRLQLKTAAGAGARDYIAGRALDEATQERFDIGFAPDARQGLIAHLTGKGVALEQLIDAGLAAKPDDGGQAYDRFRGRIIFPIRDARGRCIALGGRALDPAARAKYLNSPETEIFDKGRTLYNHGPAREAAAKGQQLVVTEGYMDVIALSQAGFEATVAPLGTAITEEQLHLLWRIHPEPIIALDGDRAGLRAAMRVIDLALPLIEAGVSVRFCLMPEGKDPDDIVRSGGAAAMQRLLDDARPMVELLWQRETEGGTFDSPERRAALDKSLRAAIGRIRDPSLRRHYADEIGRRRSELFGGGRGPRLRTPRKGWRGGSPGPAVPLPETRQSLVAVRDEAGGEVLREAVILATLIRHPAILPDFIGALEAIDLVGPGHDRIRAAILHHAEAPEAEFRSRLIEEIGEDTLEKLFQSSHLRIAPSLRARADADVATQCVAQELARLDARRGAAREIAEAMQDLEALADEGLTWRLLQAAEARERADRSLGEDRTEYDLGRNGARISRGERTAFAALLEEIDFTKGRRGSGP